MFKDAKLLYVNLTDGTTEIKTLDAETYRKYPGGGALGMYIMLKEMDPEADPLGPDNMLIFSVSQLCGIPISGQSRMCATFKSPLTGLAGDSQVGGFIPAAVACNGYDSIVIKGRAEKPVYLYINGDDVQLKDASALWGKITGDTEKAIEAEVGSHIETAIIGPAGEKMIPFSSIMHRRSRAFGRNGVGAVMGSKNLKAIAVEIAPTKAPADREALKKLTVDVKARMAANDVIVDTALNGSAGCVDGIAGDGFLPAKNFSENWSENNKAQWEKTGGVYITNNVLKRRDTCFGCAIRCKGEVEIEGMADPYYGGPEYETCATFGSYCGCNDTAQMCHANQLCNMYGLDTISCGATIAWAMDCYENGVLSKEQCDGLELNFGRADLFEPVIMKIVNKEPGLGELLAKGSAAAAKELGPEAEELVVACKGQEWPAHMVQYKSNLALNYAANPYGADHQSCEHDPALMAPKDDQNWMWPNLLADFEECDAFGVLDDNKAKFAWVTEEFYSMTDILGLCQFAWGPAWQLYGPAELLQFCKAAVDWDASYEELLEIGKRRIIMMRMFNKKQGITRKDDKLPKKAFLPNTCVDGSVAQITPEAFEAALTTYYRLAGCDPETGYPTEETLKELDLDWIS